MKENENRQLAQFTQAENDVELIIGAEMQELDASLVSCRSDISNIGLFNPLVKVLWRSGVIF